MSNPWLKKNPFMSLWLSAANSVAGSMRGHATAQAKRNAATAMTNATNDMLGIWTGAMTARPLDEDHEEASLSRLIALGHICERPWK
jgi:hypothetical protein